MSLSQRCAKSFEYHDIKRGEEYFSLGKVRLLRAEPNFINAQVIGSGSYEVEFESDEKKPHILSSWCSCPHYDDGFLCKHLWATLLAADASGNNAMFPGVHPLRVIHDDFRFSDEADLEIIGNDRPATLSLPFRSGFKSISPSFVQPAQDQALWKKQLEGLKRSLHPSSDDSISGPPKSMELFYLIDLSDCWSASAIRIRLAESTLKKNGQKSQIKMFPTYGREFSYVFPRLIHRDDREMIELLLGIQVENPYAGYWSIRQTLSHITLKKGMFSILLPKLCATQRFGWVRNKNLAMLDEMHPLSWDAGPAWTFKMQLTRFDAEQSWNLEGVLTSGDRTRPLTEPKLFLRDGLVLFDSSLGLLEAESPFEWIAFLREKGSIKIPFSQQDDFVESLCQLEVRAPLLLPKEMGWETFSIPPQPCITFYTRPKNSQSYNKPLLGGKIQFIYEDQKIPMNSPMITLTDKSRRKIIHRSKDKESELFLDLMNLGVRSASKAASYEGYDVELAPSRLSQLVPALIQSGWQVQAQDKRIRTMGQFHISISSEIDWFDLTADIRFEGTSLSLGHLLKALRKGEEFVTLDDGSLGMIPEDWLRKLAPLIHLGKETENSLRYQKTQAVFLDALLATQEKVDVDAVFRNARDKIRSFDKIEPLNASEGFVGELRGYQKEGLGWLNFLNEFSFGGCLADDMGLGKTIQVLALLENRRKQSEEGLISHKPSLVVVPRSLVYNWQEESSRFAPRLRYLDYSAIERKSLLEKIKDAHFVVTTYGILRRDIESLTNLEFDYVILDEAQAIKNEDTHVAKVTRLLNARHRLAMTGTPIENSLDDLWSIFEFLNPGMLGQLPTLNRFSKKENSQEDYLPFLAKALRPFILRRTKAQVLKELPEKTEQTLYCQLGKEERTFYNDLRNHYRGLLLKKIDTLGIQRSKIYVLEALLRLRQASCHRGLIDKGKAYKDSAKMETLMEQLHEILAEGHKALIFSQFTTLLAFVQKRLEKENLTYELLTGKTLNRQKRVEHFQQDPTCSIFLISLKAGGQGLNLTAADYVFILDPWWNPAVEAQAVDRAHRIGQTKRVFSYRLIAKDTVEEKILQMQTQKKELADAILTEDNSVLKNLTAEDLEWLLN